MKIELLVSVTAIYREKMQAFVEFRDQDTDLNPLSKTERIDISYNNKAKDIENKAEVKKAIRTIGCTAKQQEDLYKDLLCFLESTFNKVPSTIYETEWYSEI